PDEVAPEPARALLREGRDDDLVHPLVADGLHRRRVGIGMRDLAVGVDAGAPELSERAPQPPLGLRVRALGRIALRAHDQAARRAALRPFADALEQRLAEQRL